MFTSKEFSITQEQWNAINKWNNEHECTLKPRYGVKKYVGAIGGICEYYIFSYFYWNVC